MAQSSSKNAVAEICSLIRKETVEPAQQEAKEILENARLERAKILQQAKEKSAAILQEAEETLAKKHASFTASLKMSMNQATDMLKQSIEKNLFHPAISSLFAKELEDPSLITKLIEAVAKGLEKEGMDANLEVFVTKTVAKEKILAALLGKVKKRLSKEGLQDLTLAQGVELKLQGEGLTIDLTKKSLEALLAKFLRNDFKELIFQKNS